MEARNQILRFTLEVKHITEFRAHAFAKKTTTVRKRGYVSAGRIDTV